MISTSDFRLSGLERELQSYLAAVFLWENIAGQVIQDCNRALSAR